MKISDDNLKISEVFATIQGEGLNTGVPVIFIRFALCNLSCPTCDTGYTWAFQSTKRSVLGVTSKLPIQYDSTKEIQVLTAEEVLTRVLTLQDEFPGIKNIVLSGGEPLMHQRSKAFIVLLTRLRIHKFSIEIETNGTIKPTEEVALLIDQFNVSPKLSGFNSVDSESARWKVHVFTFYNPRYNAMYKFVIENDADFAELKKLQAMFMIPPYKIMLMPEGRTAEETSRMALQLVDVCKKEGYRYCNRLHLQIWHGSVRGV
jgi:organic radical activating enzyme